MWEWDLSQAAFCKLQWLTRLESRKCTRIFIKKNNCTGMKNENRDGVALRFGD